VVFTRTCSKCGLELKTNWNFCPKCGEEKKQLKKSGNRKGRAPKFWCPKCNEGRDALAILTESGWSSFKPVHCIICGTILTGSPKDSGKTFCATVSLWREKGSQGSHSLVPFDLTYVVKSLRDENITNVESTSRIDALITVKADTVKKLEETLDKIKKIKGAGQIKIRYYEE
jgi:hypothetical protein